VSKAKSSGYPAICGQCHRLIDLAEVQASIRAGRCVVHDCGRILVKGKDESRTKP